MLQYMNSLCNVQPLLRYYIILQQSSANAKGFDDLAERIKRLQPIILSVKKDENPPIILLTLLEDLER